MLHDLALREPDEGPRAERPLVRHQVAFEDIQTMSAGVSMGGVHQPRRVANEPDFRPGLRVGVQILAQDYFTELRAVSFVPRLRRGVDGKELVVRHLPSWK